MLFFHLGRFISVQVSQDWCTMQNNNVQETRWEHIFMGQSNTGIELHQTFPFCKLVLHIFSNILKSLLSPEIIIHYTTTGLLQVVERLRFQVIDCTETRHQIIHLYSRRLTNSTVKNNQGEGPSFPAVVLETV